MGLFDIFKKDKAQPVSSSNEKSNVFEVVPGVKMSISITRHVSTQDEIDAQVIPVTERIKTAIASKYGLYPHEILILDYAHTFYTENNSFQGFWWYVYGIRNMQAVLNSLVERGFLEIGDIRGTLERQTASVIKDVLKLYGLKTSGKKAEIIQRAFNEIPEDKLNKHFPQRTYKLTSLGQEELKSADYIPYVHRHGYGLDIWSMNRLIHTKLYKSCREIIWEHLNNESVKCYSDNNFGLYRNWRFSMSEFLREENKIKESLALLAEVVFVDLSGALNNFDMRFLDIEAQHFFPYEHSLATTAPGIISRIFDRQNELGYTDNELKSVLAKYMSKLSTPIQLFTIDECVSIIFLERDGDKEALNKMYEKARKTLKKKYPQVNI
jgi:hypothetical protein